jgi:hypothetical protein
MAEPLPSPDFPRDATDPSQVTSLGQDPTQPFQIPVSGSTRLAPTSRRPGNLLVILSGIIIVERENREDQAEEHFCDIWVTTQYVGAPSEELVWHAGFASLATIDGEAPGDFPGDGAPDQRAFNVATLDMVGFEPEKSPARLMFRLRVSLLGDTIFDRLSYQLYALTYRPSLPDAVRLDPTPGEPTLTR